LKDKIILRVVARLLIPFILMYAFYIQLHGEYSPGGGFQAGVIFAAAFILYALIYGLDKTMKVIPLEALRVLSAIGVFTYVAVGLVTLVMGGEFLNYSVLLPNSVEGQKMGIMLIELGVGITVFAVMLLIFYVFAQRKE